MIGFNSLGSMGRLGNQLFQIASTIGIAKKNEISFHFTQWNYENYFEYVFPKIDFEPDEYLQINKSCYEDLRLIKNKKYFISGYLQSFKYFENIDISEYFTFKKEYIFDYDFQNCISLHVRRSDYLDNTHVYPILNKNYYKNSIEYLRNQGINFDKVLIFSDDIEWCKNNLNFIPEGKIIEGNNEIIDLIVMSKCQHNIIANSTFSWWAAYLNQNSNKKVICPDKWFNDHSEVSDFVYEDLIPNNWIKIKI